MSAHRNCLNHTAALIGCIGLLVGGDGSQVLAQDKQGDTTVSITNAPKKGAAKSAIITIAPNYRTTSFEMIDDRIVLHVRLNGKVTGNMVLDTGANSILLPQAAASLGLKLEPYPEAGPKAKYGEIAHLSIDNLQLNDVSFEVSPFAGMSQWNKEHPASKIIGLLGRDAIEEWAVGIDFVSHTMGWWQGGKLSPEYARSFNSLIYSPDGTKGFVVVPPGESITLNKKVISNPAMASDMPQKLLLYTKEKDGYYCLQVKLDDIPIELVLDSGSTGTTVSGAASAKLHPLFTAPNKMQGLESEADADATTMILRSLTMGNVSFDFPLVSFVKRTKGDRLALLDDMACLGIDVLADSRIIMDFPGKALYVSQYASSNHTPGNAMERIGIFILGGAINHKITALFAGYPAAKAGMKIGDELLEVNGISVDKWADNPARAIPVKIRTISVHRKGTPKPLTFKLTAPDR